MCDHGPIAPVRHSSYERHQVQAAKGNESNDQALGQLIRQVTPQQAEAIAFMQSESHSYGVTFQILMTDGTWSLP